MGKTATKEGKEVENNGVGQVDVAAPGAVVGGESNTDESAKIVEKNTADVSTKTPEVKERSLPGPVCPECKKTNTRVTKVVKLEPDQAYPAFLGKTRKVRYYKCADCDENFKV